MKAQELNAAQVSLKGCPFCGGPGKLTPMPGASSWWRVRCEDFHCGGRTWAMDEVDKAVAAWNRRHECGSQ